MNNSFIMYVKERLHDLKMLSLKFYREEVEVIFKEESFYSALYNTLPFKGKLVSRTWGKMISEEGNIEETVIALTISKDNEDCEIFCREIETLKICKNHKYFSCSANT